MREFQSILERHLARYPQMEPQDLAKLAYQSEFGPEHLVSVTPDLLAYLIDEWREAKESPAEQIEPIGNGLCRFYLTGTQDPEQVAPRLAERFARAAAKHRGTREGLLARLEQISALNLPGWDEWLREYAALGYPPVRHSPRYREAYHPHYRVIFLEDGAELTE